MVDTDSVISLNTEDICEIIRTSGSCGVSLLKYGSLLLDFGQQAKFEKTKSNANKAGHEAAISDITHDTQTQEAIEQEELRFRADQVAQALIEDPSLAEKLILDGDLEDDADDGDESQYE